MAYPVVASPKTFEGQNVWF